MTKAGPDTTAFWLSVLADMLQIWVLEPQRAREAFLAIVPDATAPTTPEQDAALAALADAIVQLQIAAGAANAIDVFVTTLWGFDRLVGSDMLTLIQDARARAGV